MTFHRLTLLVVLASCAACAGAERALMLPLVATPDDAVPSAPPATAVAPANVPWPRARVRRLANGMTFVALPMPDVSGVAVVARMRAAGEAGPSETFGLASMTAMMLRRGSRSDTGDTEWLLHETGADGYYSWSFAHAQIRATTDAQHANAVIAAIARELRFPAFEANSLELEQREYVDAARELGTAQGRGQRALAGALFGPTSPLARGGRGPESYVTRLDVDDLVAFHATHYVPERCVFVVAGAFDEASVSAAVDAAFGGWASRSTPAEPFDPAFADAIPGYEIIDDPRDHAIIHFAIPFELATTEDRAAFSVLSLLYGNVFDSWLNLALRERDGSTYAASAAVLGVRHRGALVTELIVELDRVEGVVATLRHAATHLFRGEVLDHERALAQAQLTSRWLETLYEPEEVAMLAADLIVEDARVFDALAQDHAYVSSATPAFLREGAARIFRPDDVTIVVTGPRARIERAVHAGWNAPLPTP